MTDATVSGNGGSVEVDELDFHAVTVCRDKLVRGLTSMRLDEIEESLRDVGMGLRRQNDRMAAEVVDKGATTISVLRAVVSECRNILNNSILRDES